jgi:hypothetical protein
MLSIPWIRGSSGGCSSIDRWPMGLQFPLKANRRVWPIVYVAKVWITMTLAQFTFRTAVTNARTGSDAVLVRKLPVVPDRWCAKTFQNSSGWTICMSRRCSHRHIPSHRYILFHKICGKSITLSLTCRPTEPPLTVTGIGSILLCSSGTTRYTLLEDRPSLVLLKV